MPDGRAMLENLLEGPSSFTRLVHLDEVDSTNDEALRRVRDGAAAGLVVVADTQTAGRGRQGRTWQDRAGTDLLVSVAIGVPPRGQTLVPLATGLAVADALRRMGLTPRLKWPNDVLLPAAGDDVLRKCAGILVEVHDLRPEGPRCLVVGVGVDVDWRGTDRSGEPSGWVSVAETLGADVDRFEVLTHLLRALEAWLLDVPHDPTRLLAAYRVRCATLGAPVRITTPGGVIEGTAVDVDPTGGLVVDGVAGRHVVVAGDVEHLR